MRACWSRQGQKDEALKVLETFDKALPRHPLIIDEMAKGPRGEKLPPLIDNAQAGAAEALYGLGAALGRRGGEDLGLVYLQLALYLTPQHPLALLSLADLYESLKKPELAIKIYEQVPTSSPLRRNAEIQLAINLDTVERTDEAKTRLEKLIAEIPNDLEAIMALGNIQRARKHYAECADVLRQGHRHHREARKVELADLLFPRHLQRAHQEMGATPKPISRRRWSCFPTSRMC